MTPWFWLIIAAVWLVILILAVMFVHGAHTVRQMEEEEHGEWE